MSTESLETISEDIFEFSLIESFEDEITSGRISSIDFQQVLLSLASILRRRDLAYQIEYFRPDQPEFRLRSDKDFEDPVREWETEFSEPGRSLEIKTEDPGLEVFEGLVEELKILGELEPNDEETSREPKLNLLVSRTFQAELYSEYQRWKRYDSPFLIAVAELKTDEDWEPVGRAFKHVSQTRDILGYLDGGRVGGFFPSLYDPDPLREDLEERLFARYSEEELELSFYYIPKDISDWNTLKKRIFSPIYLNKA